MTSVVRNDPPRWAKLAVWLGLGGVCWLVVAVVVMGFALWPWPTAVLTAAVAGVVVGALWARAPQPDLELVHERKDAAIEQCLGTAFELQRVTGELPPVDDDTGPGTVRLLRSGERPAVRMFDQDAGAFVDLNVPPGNVIDGGRPIRMTGTRDVEAQDRELSEVYGIDAEAPVYRARLS